MKKIVLIISIISFSVVLSSCLFEEKDIFDKSASERLTQSVKDNLANLQTASNGWVMQYFPTVGTAGYPLIVKFDANSQCTIAGKNSITGNTTATSMYSIKTNEGTVLTFDTYNPVIHVFADPSKSPLGYGYEGDFEFTIMSATPDIVRMKGKKRGVDIYLNKLPQDQAWPAYFDAVDKFDAQVFQGATNQLVLVDSDKQYTASGASSHIMTINGNLYGFVVKPDGIHLQRSAEELSAKTMDFKISADNSRLVSTDNANIYFTGENIYTAFVNSQQANKQWIVAINDSLGATAKNLIDAVRSSLTALGYTLQQISYRYVNGKFAVSIRTASTTVGDFYYDTEITEKSVKYVYTGSSAQGGNMLNAFPVINDLIHALETSFTLVPDNGLKYKKIKLTSNSDAGLWFYIQ